MANTIEVKVPDIGNFRGVPVIEILVKPGDTVAKDQGLVTLESDKATMEVPASVAGVVKEVRVKLNDEVAEGAIVAVIETQAGRYGIVQIAGLIARRIVPFVREGDTLAVGERFGLIRFGSRVDVYLPEGVHPLVGLGQKAIAGETVLADARNADTDRSFRLV